MSVNSLQIKKSRGKIRFSLWFLHQGCSFFHDSTGEQQQVCVFMDGDVKWQFLGMLKKRRPCGFFFQFYIKEPKKRPTRLKDTKLLFVESIASHCPQSLSKSCLSVWRDFLPDTEAACAAKRCLVSKRGKLCDDGADPMFSVRQD